MAQQHSTAEDLNRSRSSVLQQLKEGEVTKKIEEQTAKLPSVGYLSFAIGSMALSAGFMLFGRRKEVANFIGLWAPSFMLIGIYNKLVKLEGSDQFNKAA